MANVTRPCGCTVLVKACGTGLGPRVAAACPKCHEVEAEDRQRILRPGEHDEVNHLRGGMNLPTAAAQSAPSRSAGRRHACRPRGPTASSRCIFRNTALVRNRLSSRKRLSSAPPESTWQKRSSTCGAQGGGWRLQQDATTSPADRPVAVPRLQRLQAWPVVLVQARRQGGGQLSEDRQHLRSQRRDGTASRGAAAQSEPWRGRLRSDDMLQIKFRINPNAFLNM